MRTALVDCGCSSRNAQDKIIAAANAASSSTLDDMDRRARMLFFSSLRSIEDPSVPLFKQDVVTRLARNLFPGDCTSDETMPRTPEQIRQDARAKMSAAKRRPGTRPKARKSRRR